MVDEVVKRYDVKAAYVDDAIFFSPGLAAHVFSIKRSFSAIATANRAARRPKSAQRASTSAAGVCGTLTR